ncbi:hypothetical protein C0995_007799 [Termitomyces sp. Mi166|nr:hypothetical protein C0995_007799 [Termitomyces sp. Mi166\
MSDTRGRCSYCYLDAGRSNVKMCARCRWTQEWRDAIQRWSLWALNLRNQPDNFLSKHLFCVELVKRDNVQNPRKQFRMIAGEVMTREKVLSLITEMKCPARAINSFKNDLRGNHTVQIMIIAEGLVKFLWFGQRDPVTGQTVPLKDLSEDPDHANIFAQYWEEAMIDVIQKGDPTLTNDYPKNVVFKMLPNLKGIVSRPKDGSGPITVTRRK